MEILKQTKEIQFKTELEKGKVVAEGSIRQGEKEMSASFQVSKSDENKTMIGFYSVSTQESGQHQENFNIEPGYERDVFLGYAAQVIKEIESVK